MNRQKDLLQRLKNLTNSQFEEIVINLEIDHSHLPHPATPTDKSIEIIKILKQKPDGLDRLEEELQSLSDTKYSENNDKSGGQLLKGAENSRSQYKGKATDISNFVGREDERKKLKKWIVQENNRMIAIVGIGGLGKSALAKKFTQDERNLTGGGIGKSSLVAKVTENIQDEFKDEFKKVIWLSLIDDPSIEETLKGLIQDVSNQRETDFSLEKLLFYIKENRYLIVLDNVETLMEEKTNDDMVGHFRTNRKEYEQMFEQLIIKEHKSCFLLTSREIPQRILDLAGDKTRLVKILDLFGLGTNEGRQIFERFDCKVNSDDDWEKIVKFYGGNPLALELAASHIKQQYDGKISEFLNGEQIVFDNIEKLLDWHFNRLSIESKDVMYWLAINREASSSDELSKDTNYATLNLNKFIQARIRQSIPLVKSEDEKRIGLQPVILEFMIGKIIKEVCREIIQEKPNILNTHALSKASIKDSLRHINNRLILIKIINKVKVLLNSGKYVTSEQSKVERIELVLTREGLFEELEKSDDFVNKKLLNESLIQCLLNDANKDESLESKLENIVLILKQQDLLKNRYAAGNILNLLCQIQRKENEKVQNITLSDYDFSGLEIRQAYLRGINLPGVNFTECTFINSIFTQDFDRIKSLAFSPKHPEREKVYLLTGHSDKKARLWDVENGNLLFVYHEHTDWIRAVAFSPTCEFFATGSDDQTIRLWNLKASLNDRNARGRCIGESLKGHTKWIWSLAFSPDGTLLASGSADHIVKLWDVSDVKKPKFLRDLKGHKNEVLSISFSADGQFIASGSADKTVKLWNVKMRKCTQTLKGHTDGVESVSFSKDGRYLASGSKDATIKIWDLEKDEKDKCIKTFDEHQKQVKSVCFSPLSEELLVSGSSDSNIMLWNVNKLEYIKTLEGHTDIIESVGFSHDGLMIASGGEDREIRLWSVSEQQCLRTLRGFTNWIWSVAFSPDDRNLASANGDWTVRLWDIEKQKECCLALKEHTSAVMSVAFRKGGKIIASSSDDQNIKLWSMEKDQEGSITNLVCINTNSEGHKDRIKCVCFSPDGSKLASAGYDAKIMLWNVESESNPRLEECQELGRHENQIWSVVFSPDGKLLASCSTDGTIKLWDVTTCECLITLLDHKDEVWSVAFNHDGTLLASGSEDKTVKLWDIRDIRNPKSVTCLHILKGHSRWIWSVAFNHDGTLLASGSGDNTVRLWDVKTGECLQIFNDHKDCVWTVAFSHNSQMLASGSSDETIKVWDVSDPRNANLKADLRAKRPYEDMNIRGAKWFTQSNTETELKELTEPIKNSLISLGAVEK